MATSILLPAHDVSTTTTTSPTAGHVATRDEVDTFVHDSTTSAQHVSLLSAMLNSHSAAVGPAMVPDESSSAPSTALSSPEGPRNGTLHPIIVVSHQTNLPSQQPNSILRRGSVSASSDNVDSSDNQADVMMDASAPSTGRALKFAMASPKPPLHEGPPLRPRTPLNLEKMAQDLEDDGDDDGDDDDDESVDTGYEEDQESATSDHEEEITSPTPPSTSISDFPFARATNYRARRHSVPAIRSPLPLFTTTKAEPGHVKVVAALPPAKTCSRHCSPPPSRSRSGSVSQAGNCSDAGPREGRAGSPMPTLPDDWDEDEEEEEEKEEEANEEEERGRPTSGGGGWRSDDAVFVTVPSRVVTAAMARNVSSPIPSPEPKGFGDMLRRASEHIPGFRPAVSSTTRIEEALATSAPMSTSPLPFACPPALDETPAMASSMTPNADDLAARLEETLFSQSSNLVRARSLGARLPPSNRLTPWEDHSSISHRPSQPIACPPRRRHDGSEHLL